VADAAAAATARVLPSFAHGLDQSPAILQRRVVTTMFGHKHDVAAEAVIVEDHIAHHSGGSGQGNLHEWVADVRPPDGEPFRTTIPTPGFSTDFRHPIAGDVVTVLIAHDGTVHFDKSDPRLSLKAERAEHQVRHDEIAAASPGSSPRPYASAAEQPTTGVAARLAELQELHNVGAISDTEYHTQRQRIINSI
jgi:hypothetical protein